MDVGKALIALSAASSLPLVVLVMDRPYDLVNFV
jgi:hypothetical protein